MFCFIVCVEIQPKILLTYFSFKKSKVEKAKELRYDAVKLE
jgi:hypothetical protein